MSKFAPPKRFACAVLWSGINAQFQYSIWPVQTWCYKAYSSWLNTGPGTNNTTITTPFGLERKNDIGGSDSPSLWLRLTCHMRAYAIDCFENVGSHEFDVVAGNMWMVSEAFERLTVIRWLFVSIWIFPGDGQYRPWKVSGVLLPLQLGGITTTQLGL